MNNSLFNTTQETATRLTLCLPLLSRPSTIDEITAIDLIATYMKTFGFGQRNLHGDGPHALAEYDARRKRIQAGLAQLVIVGAATVDSGMFPIFGSIARRLRCLLSTGCSALDKKRL